VRLAEIDTPESKQPYGNRAKQALSDLAFSQQARVVVQDTDRYGRTVGRVYVGAMDVNAEMVKHGAAWVYRQFARDQSLFRLEEQAKAAKRGLWGLPEAERCPPWDWRGGLARPHRPRRPVRRLPDRRLNFSRQQRLHLCRQAVLPGNDELRGGEVLSHAVRGSHTGRQS